MRLNSIELAFLERLSPPVFDHRLLDRVVEAGYVTTLSSARDAVHYEITDTGRAAVIAITS
jgi:DNA-binding PadR family transcriptional regulator